MKKSLSPSTAATGQALGPGHASRDAISSSAPAANFGFATSVDGLVGDGFDGVELSLILTDRRVSSGHGAKVGQMPSSTSDRADRLASLFTGLLLPGTSGVDTGLSDPLSSRLHHTDAQGWYAWAAGLRVLEAGLVIGSAVRYGQMRRRRAGAISRSEDTCHHLPDRPVSRPRSVGVDGTLREIG